MLGGVVVRGTAKDSWISQTGPTSQRGLATNFCLGEITSAEGGQARRPATR